MNLQPSQILKILSSEPIAINTSIRELDRLKARYGPGRWRKMKGTARFRDFDGLTRLGELHWYEAHGVGRFEFKLKLYLD